MIEELSLYIHVPFCAVRCPYCDFNTYAGLEALYEPYAAALEAEIRLVADVYGHPRVRTIFVGGGTPTVLTPELLAGALDTCRREFNVAEDAEVTSEANPGTVDLIHFAALREMGINRLSMGVQSFDDAELRWLGRIHTASEVADAFAAARAAGFANINLDFIFGLPGQDPRTWQETLARAVALGPEHLSLYSLTVEQGTPLADWVRQGQVAEPDDDLAAELYLSAGEHLDRHGYVQYEISNWARGDHRSAQVPGCSAGASGPSRLSATDLPSFACQHNLVYWRHEPYLGFGPGAHSFDGERRWWNVRPVPEYIQRLKMTRTPEKDGETIERRLAMGETMMLGLRLVREGVANERFRSRFGVELGEVFGDEIRHLTQRGLLEWVEDHIRLTGQGRLLGNQVFASFLPD